MVPLVYWLTADNTKNGATAMLFFLAILFFGVIILIATLPLIIEFFSGTPVEIFK